MRFAHKQHSSMLARQVVSVLCFVLSGIVITLYNRWLLHTHKFHFPILLLLTSCLSNLVLLGGVVLCAFPDVRASDDWITRISCARFARLVFPLAFCFAADVVLTTAAFETLNIATTEAIKANIPTLLLLVRFCTGSEPPSFPKLAVIVCLSAGSALLLFEGELTFEGIGALLSLLATVFGSLRLFVMETVMQGERPLGPMLSYLYVTPVAAALLVVPFLLLELGRLRSSGFLDRDTAGRTVELLLGGAFLAFFLNMSSFAAVAYTSALALCVFGTVRLLLIVAASVIVLDDFKVSVWNAVGFAVTLLGVLGYQLLSVRGRGAYEPLQQQQQELDADLELPHAGDEEEKPRSSAVDASRDMLELAPILAQPPSGADESASTSAGVAPYALLAREGVRT